MLTLCMIQIIGQEIGLTTNIVKNSDKNKNVYSCYGIAFDGAGLWCFGNDLTGNDVGYFCADNSSSSHPDNRKNIFLTSGEEPVDDINGSVSTAEKYFSINFSKAKTKLCLSLHRNGNNSYLFVNKKET